MKCIRGGLPPAAVTFKSGPKSVNGGQNSAPTSLQFWQHCGSIAKNMLHLLLPKAEDPKDRPDALFLPSALQVYPTYI